MDRRTFLLGTAALAGSAAGGIASARADVARIQLADLRGSLPATDFGIRPGAIDDQSQALQSAIDKAKAGGQPLFLPPGRYEVSNLSIPSRLKIIGIPGETRLVYTGGGHLLQARDAHGIGLDGLVLDGANRALAGHASGLAHFLGVSDLTVTNTEIVGSAVNALALEGVSGRIAGSRFSGARKAGVWSVTAKGLSIIDNVVTDCGDGGILVHRWEGGEDRTIVSRNRIERIGARSGGAGQNGNGINIFRADNVTVADNQIGDCAFAAVRSNAGSNVQITGNQCLRSGETAIRSEFGTEGAVISNNVVDGASTGISITSFDRGGRMTAVTGNVVRNLRNGAQFPDQMGLDFGIGIAIQADAAVTGNIVEGAPTLGLLMGWGPSLRNVVATGNVIRASRIGIGVSVVEGAGDVVIAANVLSDLAEGAIRGMRWNEFVTGDLAGIAGYGWPHLTIGENRVG